MLAVCKIAGFFYYKNFAFIFAKIFELPLLWRGVGVRPFEASILAVSGTLVPRYSLQVLAFVPQSVGFSLLSWLGSAVNLFSAFIVE
jgi:hypothetical protein